jgi:hypothetical protein
MVLGSTSSYWLKVRPVEYTLDIHDRDHECSDIFRYTIPVRPHLAILLLLPSCMCTCMHEPTWWLAGPGSGICAIVFEVHAFQSNKMAT